MKVVRIIVSLGIIGVVLIGSFGGIISEVNAMEAYNINKAIEKVKLAPKPDQLIRFHVLANSDNKEDQDLKNAVRDAILKDVSPRLAVSQSLDQSRQILQKLRPKMENIGRSVVKMWGKNYNVSSDFGNFPFPTKSYGSLVLPAGDYEALRIVIGEGQGSNWWCVLFPPLCFVDIEQSTAVQVDEKQVIPINNAITQNVMTTMSKPKVRFYLWEKIKKFLGIFITNEV